MVEYALEYLSMGYPVFPVCSPLMGMHQHRRNGKLVDCAPDKRGKNPMTSWKDCQTELPSADEVRSWWRRWPDANIGMATGRLPGIVVLDCDSGEARRLALERGGLDRTPAVWTGTPGGTHFWMAHPGYDVHNFAKEIPGTDFRGDGGYVLLPPSLHHKGARYRWAENTVGMKPAPVPDWLDQLFQAKAQPSTGGEWSGEPIDVDEMLLQGFPEGERDTGLFKLACRFRHDDQSRDYAEAMIAIAARNCQPPFDVDEAIEKVRYVYQKYEPGGISPTVEMSEDDWFSPTRAGAKPAAESPPAVFTRPISELLAMPDTDPDWMVDQLFTVASNGWVAAEPKVGKSWIVLELAYALSAGMPFLGRFAIKQQRRVLYVQEEDSVDRVKRRLKRLIRGDVTRPPPPDENFRYSIRQGFKLDSLTWLEVLRLEMIEYKSEVVIMDVFNRLHGSDENKQQEMTSILNNLTRLTNDYGVAFIIVHHNRKPQQGDEARGNQRIRGSGVLGGWGECSLYLRRSREKDTIIVTPESKDAPEMDDFTVALTDTENGGVVLEMGESLLVDQMTPADRVVIDAVQRITDRGIGATVQAIAEALGKDRTTVQKRLTKLVEAGYLECMAISNTNNPTKIYSVVTQ